MATLERGIVKFFDSRPEKRFGFILMPSEEEVFFHFNDGAPVEVDAAGPTMNTTLCSREPHKGDILLFQRSANRKGAKAAPWCFAEDWERAEQEIARRTVYRLVKQTGAFHVKRDPVVVWEGHNLQELRQQFGNAQLGLHYVPGGSDWTKYWFEEKTVTGWSLLPNHYDQVNDPRTFKIEPVRVVKSPMPLEFAKRNLKAAQRDMTLDRLPLKGQITWVSGGKKVGYGHMDGDEKRVTTEETGEYNRTTFEGREAQELIELGEPGKTEWIGIDSDYSIEDIEFDSDTYYQ